ncbi:MAG: hypothetical protein CO080_03585 [Nitrospirae bacterium CG_4_9_14_0_8_um_filter_70_14]|nr:MAG: hypothetical protein CO080_03585 [Nitrospirae bacterium CG_4_9_14_0_8_um_filter_70_14]
MGFTRLVSRMLLLAVGVAACATVYRGAPVAPVPRLLFMGHVEGYVEPCGCSEGQLGGEARRAELLRRLRAAPGATLLVDAGNRFIATGPAGEIQAATLAAAGVAAGVAAINLGEDERHLGADFLSRDAGVRGLPWVHANSDAATPPWPGEVARTVRAAEQKGCDLADLALAELRTFSPLVEEDVYQVLTLEGSLAQRSHLGGTAPAAVRAAIGRARRRLG